MTKKNSNKTKTPSPAIPTGVEFYFDKFAASHQNPATKLIYTIFIPLLVFSVFVLAWCIQFPYIKFLGRYNADFNWSSVLLAIMVYYYIKLSPVLGYFILFVLLLFFRAITYNLALVQTSGGMQLWAIITRCAVHHISA